MDPFSAIGLGLFAIISIVGGYPKIATSVKRRLARRRQRKEIAEVIARTEARRSDITRDDVSNLKKRNQQDESR